MKWLGNGKGWTNRHMSGSNGGGVMGGCVVEVIVGLLVLRLLLAWKRK